MFLKVSLRNSLLLSILQQILLEDKEDRTKISAINSIAFLVTFIDEDDKYPQVILRHFLRGSRISTFLSPE